MRRSATVAAIALGVLSASPARAQSHPPSDSARRDSLHRDSVHVRPVESPLMLLIPVVGVGLFAAMGGAFAFAPAPFALLPRQPDHPPLGFLDEHRAVYVTAGAGFGTGRGWATSANAEAMHGHWLNEASFEDFQRRERVQHISVAGGYLWHPRRGTAGGVTIGYQYARVGWMESGATIGFPFFIGDVANTFRIEPTYTVSVHGALWNYRLQYDRRIGRSPYFAGLRAVGKSAPLNSSHPLYAERPEQYFAQAASILFGARF